MPTYLIVYSQGQGVGFDAADELTFDHGLITTLFWVKKHG